MRFVALMLLSLSSFFIGSVFGAERGGDGAVMLRIAPTPPQGSCYRSQARVFMSYPKGATYSADKDELHVIHINSGPREQLTLHDRRTEFSAKHRRFGSETDLAPIAITIQNRAIKGPGQDSIPDPLQWYLFPELPSRAVKLGGRWTIVHDIHQLVYPVAIAQPFKVKSNCELISIEHRVQHLVAVVAYEWDGDHDLVAIGDGNQRTKLRLTYSGKGQAEFSLTNECLLQKCQRELWAYDGVDIPGRTTMENKLYVRLLAPIWGPPAQTQAGQFFPKPYRDEMFDPPGAVRRKLKANLEVPSHKVEERAAPK